MSYMLGQHSLTQSKHPISGDLSSNKDDEGLMNASSKQPNNTFMSRIKPGLGFSTKKAQVGAGFLARTLVRNCPQCENKPVPTLKPFLVSFSISSSLSYSRSSLPGKAGTSNQPSLVQKAS